LDAQCFTYFQWAKTTVCARINERFDINRLSL
jgi:hypothetical protein